jgi:hypothetical protein
MLTLAPVAFSSVIEGKITDPSGHALPYVSIYIKGSTIGTTSNAEGVYRLTISSGSYKVIYRILGYKATTKNILVEHLNIVVNVQLEDEAMNLKEVTIIAGEDPAYEMIRHAMKMRKHYLEQVKSYSCDVYIKGLERVLKHPKKFLGHKITNDDLDLIDTTGIVYLSESVSRFNFKQQHNIREEMISSKVSGDKQGFSYNSASDLLFNFYENLLEVQNLSRRGFISPIALQAMLYYKYRFIGDFKENGRTIDKIEVIPKRKNDPVFRGYIYIEESGWRIYSTDLYLTKDAQVDFIDTLIVQQSFIPVDTGVWMPFTNKFLFSGGFIGFKIKGVYMGVNSNYTLNPDLPKNFFRGEQLKINEGANKKDSAYWRAARPIQLTSEEEKDYSKRDSVMKIRNSKPYQDSVDKAGNKFSLSGFIFGGYNFSKRHSKEEFHISSLIGSVGYNTVQGFVTGTTISYSKKLEHNRFLIISPEVSYGFGNHLWNGGLYTYYSYKPESFRKIYASGGIETRQFAGFWEIPPLINTFYTLLDKRNYMKVYQSNYVSIGHGMEIINGVNFTAGAMYEDRLPLFNTTGYSIIKRAYSFTSNNPIDEHSENTPPFLRNQAVTFNAALNIKFQQKYTSRPYEKIVSESKYPELVLYYKKGVPGLGGSDVNFDYASVGLSGKFNLKILGHSKWTMAGGKFFNNNSMSFMDYHHFAGDKTFFSFLGSNSFELLDYYKYSTKGQYIACHFEHNFGGFILNKFPLLRKLNLGEIAGIHYLTANTLPQYVELYAGIEKFRIFRFSFVTSFMHGQRSSTGFRLGVNLN